MKNLERNLKINEYKFGRTTYFISSQINDPDPATFNQKIMKLIKKDINLLSSYRDEVLKCHPQTK
ncbi:MAG: hypothetical protein KHZ62_10655 [Clostridiales bacterium]|nr:hypothetical protein [Clostridiales bacterium]